MSFLNKDQSHNVYLLDTMNNILGILILVLILTQIIGANTDGTTARSKDENSRLKLQLDGELHDAQLLRVPSVDSVKAAEHNVELLHSLIKQSERILARIQGAESGPQDAASLRQFISDLNSLLEKTKSRALLEEEQARAEQKLADARAKRQELLDQLKALQDAADGGGQAIDFGKGRQPTEHVHPNRIMTVVCRNGKVTPANFDALGRALSDASDTYRADCAKRGADATYDGLVAFVNGRDIRDSAFSITLRTLFDGNGYSIILDPMKGDAWESSDDISKPTSSFRTKLAAEDSRKTVISFSVWADSFDIYVKASLIAKAMGFRIAWLPYSNDEEMKETVRPGSPPPQDSGIDVEK